MKKFILLFIAIATVLTACKEEKEYTKPEMLVVSPVILNFKTDDNGVYKAEATFQIDTDAEDVYLFWAETEKEATYAMEDEIIEKQKPASGVGEGVSKQYTLSEEFPVFKTYYMKVIAVNGDRFTSKVVSFDTWKSGEYNQTVFIEADEAECVAEQSKFTITLWKDKDKFAESRGGYKIVVTSKTASATDGQGKYIPKDGTFTISADDMLFNTIIPGVGAYSLNKRAELKVEKKYSGWDIAVSFSADYQDWNTFQKVKEVTFFQDNKALTIKESPNSSTLYITSDTSFEPDLATVKTAIINTDKDCLLQYEARSAKRPDGSYDFLFLSLRLPETVDGDLKNLNGTYPCLSNINDHSAFTAAVTPLQYLLFLPGDTSWCRFSSNKVSGNWPEKMMKLVLVKPGTDVVKLTMSDNSNWMQLEVDITDFFSGYHVRCKTIIMIEDIILS